MAIASFVRRLEKQRLNGVANDGIDLHVEQTSQLSCYVIRYGHKTSAETEARHLIGSKDRSRFCPRFRVSARKTMRNANGTARHRCRQKGGGAQYFESI